MAAGVKMAHTSAPGMLRRNAVRNGMGLPPRRTYTAPCVDSNKPQAVQIARITHQRGYDERARRPDVAKPEGITRRLSSLSRNLKHTRSNGQDWNDAATNRRPGAVKCDAHATNSIIGDPRATRNPRAACLVA